MQDDSESMASDGPPRLRRLSPVHSVTEKITHAPESSPRYILDSSSALWGLLIHAAEWTEVVDLYIPRKCSATTRLIPAKEHGSVQFNVGQIDENGAYTGEFFALAIAGFIRTHGESDTCLNRLLFERGLLTFSN